MSKLSLIGAGWLGIDLIELFTIAGYCVTASFRSEQNKNQILQKGGKAYFLDLNENLEGLKNFLLDTKELIVSIPPGKVQNYGSIIKRISSVAENCGIEKIIFTSSTSVYPDGELVTEDADLHSSFTLSELLKAEKAILESTIKSKYILRLSGLIGADRHPGKFLAGKTDLTAPNAPVNLVHKADVIQIIIYCIYGKISPGIYNVCAEEHPTKKDYYTIMSNKIGLVPPVFLNDNQKGKLILAEKMKKQIEYNFKSIWDL
jgi:hypothetical protein